MSGEITTLYLPCEVGQVRVRLGYSDTLSPLEETALRVIAAAALPDGTGERPRPVDVPSLTKLLGLGHRVVVDLVHDLWRAGYLTVDFTSGAIALSGETQDRLDSGRLAEMAGLESEERRVELMMERLTGYVMPRRGARAPGDPRYAVRHTAARLTLADAGQTEIHAAVQNWLRNRNRADADDELAASAPGAPRERGGPARRDRERRILSVRSSARDRRTGGGKRWYPINVRAELNTASDRLIITVVDPRFPADRRELASERLTRLAEEFPRESFVARLREAAEEKLVEPPGLEELIDRLAERAAGCGAVPAARRRDEHLGLADEARRVAAVIAAREAREVDVEPVHGGRDHLAVVGQLIDEAETQLVIVCPWVTRAALQQVTPQLRRAMDRGVQVVVVWGIAHQAALPEDAQNALDSLTRYSRTTPMLRPQVSARTHAKLVICDDRAALVTSRNVLSATGAQPETGLLLRTPGGGGGEAVRDLLGWVRTNVPGPISRSIFHRADRFPGGGTPAAVTAAEDEPVPEEPPEGEENPAAVQAWQLAWVAKTEQLRIRPSGRPRPSARTVLDGEHRELLWLALNSARRRVVIASAQLSDEVVNARLIDAVRGLLDRGVAVTIGYDERGGAERGQTALDALTELATAHPGLFTLHSGTGHAKVLVWDDDVVVGSFNYLSYGGFGSLGGRHLQRSELSVRVTGAALADQVAELCGEPPGVAAAPGTDGAAAAPALSADAPARVTTEARVGRDIAGHSESAVHAARRVLDRVAGEQRPGEIVRAELERSDDPWSVLPVLTELGEGPEIRSALAFCLTGHADGVAPEEAHRHRRRLVRSLWCAGAFVEAAVLSRLVSDAGRGEAADAAGPRAAITEAVGRRGLPGGPGALYTAAAADDLTAAERRVLLAVAVGELLLSRDSMAADVAEYLASDDGGPWAELAGAADAYTARTVGASTAELMARAAGQLERTAELADGWSRLDLALLEAQPVPVNIDGAKKTHAALFNDTGPFGQIGDAVNRRDLTALARLAEELLPARERPEDLVGRVIDTTWREVAPRNELLTGKTYRGKYVKRLAEVVSAARALLTAAGRAERPDGDEPHPELVAAAAALAETYRRLRPGLAEAPPDDEAALRAVLADLDSLIAGREAPSRAAGAGADGEADTEAGLATALRGWQGRWRYPALAAALHEADVPDDLPGLLLAGLVDPLAPEDTAVQLIEDGRYAVADALREQAELSPEAAARIVRRLRTERTTAKARVRHTAEALLRRARRAGAVLRADLHALAELADEHRPAAESVLGDLARQVRDAERARADEITRAARERVAALGEPARDLAADWLKSVEACAEAREFDTAATLLEQDPTQQPPPGPRTVPQLAEVWPFDESSAAAVLGWYFEGRSDAPRGFPEWCPPAGDADAWQLLAALRDHIARPSEDTAARLCCALQQLVGADRLPFPVDPAGNGFLSRVCLPDDRRFPPLPLLGRGGVRTWIAGPADPPPEPPEDGPVVWLVTGVTSPADPPVGTLVVDLPFLLRLAAPGTAGSADRLVNVLRRLGAQLDPADLLAGTPAQVDEPRLGWVLHLLGVTGDAVVADAVHHDSGGRSEVLVPLLDALVTPAVPGRGRYQDLDVAALNGVREDDGWRVAARERLLAPHAGDLPALMLLRVAAAFDDPVFTLKDLRGGIEVAGRPEHAALIPDLTDLPAAASRLCRSGLFQETPGGLLRLPSGLRDLLAEERPGYVPLAEARTAIEAEYRALLDANALFRAELGESVVRVIGHWVANWKAAVRSALKRDDTARALEILDGLEPISAMYQRAAEPQRLLRLAELLDDHLGQVQLLNPGVDCKLAGGEDLCVEANPWLLGHAFLNLFDNARLSIERTGREFGVLRVTMTVVERADGPPSCRIDIEDSGVGIAEDARRRLAEGRQFSGWGGRGTGVRTSREWLAHYGGELEFLPDVSELGGAHARVVLPVRWPS
ncbi:ATP-binding protein [Actinomadura sp. NPDC000600]|uniref:ATP-binding protein n=1 Tax=Actinomadura sp. NPDC000600 TaxID=3154262 RepID=UPI0033952617